VIPRAVIWPFLLLWGCDIPSCGAPPNPERPGAGRAEWIFRTAGQPTTPTVFADTSIAIGSAGGRVVRIGADGAVRWSVDARGPVVGLAKSFDDRTLLVGAVRGGAGAIVALDAATGRTRWEQATDSAPLPSARPDGVIVAASTDVRFFTAQGSPRGSYDVGKELAPVAPALLEDGSIAIAMNDGTIAWLDGAGSERFRSGDARLAHANSLEAIAGGGVAVLAEGHLAVLDSGGRDVLRMDGSYRGRLGVLRGGGFVVVGGDGRVSALGPDGRVRWRRNFERSRGEGEDREVLETPVDVAAAHDGGAYVVVAKGVDGRLRRVVRLSAAGRVLWREKLVGLAIEARPLALPHALILPTGHWNHRVAKTPGGEIGHDRVTRFRD